MRRSKKDKIKRVIKYGVFHKYGIGTIMVFDTKEEAEEVCRTQPLWEVREVIRYE